MNSKGTLRFPDHPGYSRKALYALAAMGALPPTCPCTNDARLLIVLNPTGMRWIHKVRHVRAVRKSDAHLIAPPAMGLQEALQRVRLAYSVSRRDMYSLSAPRIVGLGHPNARSYCLEHMWREYVLCRGNLAPQCGHTALIRLMGRLFDQWEAGSSSQGPLQCKE